MFKRDDSNDARIDTLISSKTRIQGDVVFSGGLHLDGSVSGSVKAQDETPSRLVVSETGVVEGSVVAQTVDLNGAVKGDIVASTRVVLGARARVEGNLHYGAIEMASGAQINGKLVKLADKVKTHD
jgi:cytoskeletal protein CcmA (bactofilin family)